ncbi:MAG: DUF4956 domain-containing protein, partial [Atopobiaceae bacterium]|nr:DUF4956 domain-containing protein [Atopobiaceae bacterium]
MFESLFTTASTATATIELVPLLMSVAAALALGLALAAIYCYRSRFTRSFVTCLALLPAIVAVVIMMVNGNLGAGVAVAGAFSLVRFRSVPGSARDIAFIFLAMAVGLVCGMGYVAYAAIVTIVLGGANLLYQMVGLGSDRNRRDRTVRITVPEDLEFDGMFDEVLGRYTATNELRSVQTTNMGSLYRLEYGVRLNDMQQSKAML